MPAPNPRHFEVDRALLHRGGEARGWANLGDWSRATSYAEACEALAVRVGEAAALRSGDVVLEVACGEGEGLSVWLERFGVQLATGLDVHPRFLENARARLTHVFGARARFELGDAVDLRRFPSESFDAVLCVDAAYHFDSRRRFVDEAVRVLRPGRRLAVSDLVLHHDPRGLSGSAAIALAARVCKIPRRNMVTEEHYLEELARAGLEDLTIEHLDVEVLGGFASFVRRHRRANRHEPSEGWRKLVVTAWAADVAHRRRWLRYVVAIGARGAQGKR